MANEKAWSQLFEILAASDPDLDVYVYRIDGYGRRQTPYLLRTWPFPELMDMLRDEYGGGEYGILIRDGRTMVLSGEFGIQLPRARA